MKNIVFVTLFLVIILTCTESRKTSRSRSSGSGRGSSRKTNSNPQPVPTSFSNPQASAPKPSLFGWQEKPSPARNTHTYPSKQPNPSTGQNHGYPSSQTGLSGNTPVKQPPAYQESIQRNNAPQQNAQRPSSPTNNQPSHAYPASNGLSGSSGSASYPQGSGLSGSGPGTAQRPAAGYPQNNGAVGTGVGYPHGTGASGVGGAPPPYGYKPGSAGNYPAHGANNYHPQGPPPPYSNHGSPYGGYSGYGGHGFNPSPQMPGYFGNYGNNNGRGFGGVSRSGSALGGLGLAGAGIGTVLTGLALWNLARSTGHHHHTVIYDNRGQPVAVAPANGTDPAVDSILKDLVNCTLTISSDNATEVLAIPCAIATSFTPEADVKDANTANSKADNTKCTVTVVTTAGKEFMTTIPCSILLNTAAENNVTEPPLVNDDLQTVNSTAVPGKDTPVAVVPADQPSALKLTENPQVACQSHQEEGGVRDPLNPCLAVTHNLTVIPLEESTTPTSLSSQ